MTTQMTTTISNRALRCLRRIAKGGSTGDDIAVSELKNKGLIDDENGLTVTIEGRKVLEVEK